MTGQYAIQYVSRDINKYLNTVLKTENKDLLITCDTDSAFFNFGPIVDKYYKGKTDLEITDILNKILDLKIKPVIAESLKNLNNSMNAFHDRLDLKLEKIASVGFFTGKKRYAVKVIENEGIRYAEPDIAITGIEVVRSSTPKIARKWLLEAIELILDEKQDELISYVESKRSEFRKQSPEDIAFPRSANNLREYSDTNNIYKAKGCPIGPRAALLYNHYIDKNSLSSKYELIREGDKMKFLYLKEPNPIRENIIAFVQEMPLEFNLHKYIDYDTQFEKVFIDPLKNISEAINWKIEETSSLDDFF